MGIFRATVTEMQQTIHRGRRDVIEAHSAMQATSSRKPEPMDLLIQRSRQKFAFALPPHQPSLILRSRASGFINNEGPDRRFGSRGPVWRVEPRHAPKHGTHTLAHSRISGRPSVGRCDLFLRAVA
jgi:hypothetical protein